jgi:hypothetical protein
MPTKNILAPINHGLLKGDVKGGPESTTLTIPKKRIYMPANIEATKQAICKIGTTSSSLDDGKARS